VDVFRRHVLAAPLDADKAKIRGQVAQKLEAKFGKNPVNASINLSDDKFAITSDASGLTVDKVALKSHILDALSQNTDVKTPMITLGAEINAQSLEPTRDKLQKELQANIFYTYKGKSVQAKKHDIASWFTSVSGEFIINDTRLKQFIHDSGASMGVSAKNLTAAAIATKNSMASGGKLSLALEPYDETKTIKYCVGSRGVDASQLKEVRAKLKTVYGDIRGWSLDGQAVFDYAENGCDFTVWLSGNDQMTSFGGACTEFWNCMSGNNVVINADRWNQTTPAWKASGGNIEDYRTMLVNHETGHWLGFLDSYTCPSEGQSAPIMLQQSVNLRGCVFNIWPVRSELDQLRRTLSF
jgi:hypothetical protein